MKLFLTVLFTLTWDKRLTLQQLSVGNNLLTSALYNEIAKTSESNIFFSPLSLEIVLAVAQSGAKDETAEELRTVLHLPDTKESTELAFKPLFYDLKNNVHLQIANKIYIEKKYPIKEEFNKTAVDIYKANVKNIFFFQTVKAKTRLILLNSLYFDDSWELGFKDRYTYKKKFYKNDVDVIQVDTIHLTREEINYCEDKNLKVKFIELPFTSSKFSIIFALPDEPEGINAVETQLEKVFTRHQFRKEIVDIAIPKLKIKNFINFRRILKHLGITKAFSPEADFSGIAGQKGDLILNYVLQTVFMNVNENGVEAAAAPDIDFIGDEAAPPSKKFIADHPFIFYIQYENLILFAGRISDPKY